MDNRDISQGRPNNKVLITCEHASNDIKYTKLHDYESEFVRSQEYFDIGAADLTYAISEQLRCLSVLGNYSKLFIDPAKPLVDWDLIRPHY